jgi:hypothetical protein
MSMICTQCGCNISGRTAACPACGARLAAQGMPAQSMPAQSIPAQGVAAQGVAGQGMPAQGMPPQGMVAQSAAGRFQPAQPARLAEHAASPAFRLELSRLTNSDRITGIGSLLLIVSLFLPWYGVDILGISAEADGLTVHGYLYIVLLLCVAIIAYLVTWAGFEELPVRLPLSHEQRLLVASGLNTALVLLAFLTKPDGTGWRFGAFAGLLAALAATAPLVISAVQGRKTRA